jgi:capsular exopolysaccharide synthesis family protein
LLPSEPPQAQPQAQADAGAVLENLWHVLNKSRWLIIAIASFVVAGVTFYTLGQTKIYRATAMLQIDPSPPSPLGRDVPAIVQLGDAFWNNQEYYGTQYKVLASRRTAVDAVRALGLNQDAGFLKQLPRGTPTPPMKVTVDQAASILLSHLKVDPVRDSRLVTLTIDDADPERARKVLAAVIDTYLQHNIDEGVSANSSAGDWLRDQLGKLKSDLETSELALHEYKSEKNILSVSMEEQSNMLREEMTRLNQVLTDVRARREHIASRAAELKKVSLDDPVDLPSTELLSNGLLGNLRTAYMDAKADVASAMGSGKGANHPDVLAAMARVDGARTSLREEIRNVQGAVMNDLVAVGKEVAGLSGLLDAAKQRAMDLNLLEIEYRRLERTKINNEKLYGLVLERTKESDLASMMRFNNVRLLEEPIASKTPVSPRVPLNIAIGAIAGIVLGLAAAAGREQLDRSIRGSDDVERTLGLPFLGTLPLASRAEPSKKKAKPPRNAVGDVPTTNPELLAFEQPSSALAEAARGIRTNLIFMSPDQPFRQLLVTSAAPGEGKTTVASAIAVAMAMAAQKVLLVDCDLRRPRLHRVYERSNEVGVTSATLDPSLLETSSLATHVPNLDLLPSGPMVPNPAEFLQSAAFATLLKTLRNKYDRVVIDSPPASVVSDSAILSTQVDGAVFVVRASKTQRETARKAVRAISDVSGRIIGVVLNAFDFRRPGYGGYYYYHYSHYKSDERPGIAASSEA